MITGHMLFNIIFLLIFLLSKIAGKNIHNVRLDFTPDGKDKLPIYEQHCCFCLNKNTTKCKEKIFGLFRHIIFYYSTITSISIPFYFFNDLIFIYDIFHFIPFLLYFFN